ncbi:MAG: histidinol-phosphate transaminase [Lachnospiraceae bacterium]|nr:histidinol-phosphate transaminase [Lachnospiraceae bacterium]
MSRFFSKKYDALTPYTPGEQPRERKYVKLNTNESPFPPSPYAMRMAREEAGDLQLYSDPTVKALTSMATEKLGIESDRILFTNGSDEILNFAFMAFCDADHPAVFPDVTYGFYPVYAALNGIPYEEIPLREDFTIDVSRYLNVGKTVFIANPNAPTGIALPLSSIEEIVRSNPMNVVVIDEAYVDFGAESALKLTEQYGNLLVIQTFSKSRSLAGARLGFGVGSRDLIRDLNTIKYSTNPYNVNRMTMAAGIGALYDTEYFEKCRKAIMETREYTVGKLVEMGFTVLPSKANFLFIRSEKTGGKALYEELKARGVLVRHFEKSRLKDWNRVTVGSREEMDCFLKNVREIEGGTE